MVRTHQPGQAVFRSVLPEDIDWKPFPAFPPSVRLAVVVGQPSEPGPYVIRVKVPSGVKLMPHRHPEDRVYTVMSGVFYIGLGDQFDGDKVEAYPPGSVIVLPGNTSHFHWAKSGEYVTQVTAIGPLGIEYLDPGDDPRKCTAQLGRSIVASIHQFGRKARSSAAASFASSSVAKSAKQVGPLPEKSCEMRTLAPPERGKDLADDRREAQRRRLKVVAARRGMVEEPPEASAEVQKLRRSLLGRGKQV